MDLSFVYWDHSYNSILLLNLLVVIALFTSLRLFSGTIAHINASDELLKKDNSAFGVSLAGVTFAVTILLSGTVYGDPETDFIDSAIAVGVYGVVGIVLMAITRIIFDKLALPQISLRDEISKGNMAVAIADTGNVLAAAIILRAIMVWITDHTLEALVILLGAYAISQVILTVTTFVRLKLFKMFNKDTSIEEELQNNNIALALTFAGRKIGTAFAITVASNLVVYEVYDLKTLLLPWVGVSVAIILLLKALAYAAEQIVLFRVDLKHEILQQKNIAIGALLAVIYLSLALLVAEL